METANLPRDMAFSAMMNGMKYSLPEYADENA
jgi:hypothetical protein